MIYMKFKCMSNFKWDKAVLCAFYIYIYIKESFMDASFIVDIQFTVYLMHKQSYNYNYNIILIKERSTVVAWDLLLFETLECLLLCTVCHHGFCC